MLDLFLKMKNLKRVRITFVVCLVLFFAISAFAQEQKEEEEGLRKTFDFKADNPDAPLYVKSDALSLDSKERVFTYEGNVEAMRETLFVTSERMIGSYNEKNEIENVVFEDNVVITRGEELRATSERAVYNVAKAQIELTEGPELQDGGNILIADKVTIFVDEDRSLAEGDVRVKVISTNNDKDKK